MEILIHELQLKLMTKLIAISVNSVPLPMYTLLNLYPQHVDCIVDLYSHAEWYSSYIDFAWSKQPLIQQLEITY